MSWNLGNIKFYSEEKQFGYLIDSHGYWNSKEYYFDKNCINGYLFKTDDKVCFKFKIDAVGKKVISEIKLIDEDFLNENFDELHFYFKIQLIEYLPKEFQIKIKQIAAEYGNKITGMKQDPFFNPEKIEIDDYLNDFKIDLVINTHNKVGDEAFINIFYSISNPKLDYISIPEFKSSIFSHRGLINIYQIERDFIKNEKKSYEKKIPQLLSELKINLKKNYLVNKTKYYHYSFNYLFEKEIKESICKIGIQKTMEELEIVFMNFIKNVKDDKNYNYKYSVIKNKIPDAAS
mgnify:CR=1 FL=1